LRRIQKHLIVVGLFAIAMAYIESAVVVYLRAVYKIDNLMLDMPPMTEHLILIEIGREICTLVMLVTVGWVAGRQRQSRIGYVVFAFGLWDIFYYIWLYVFIGWPTSLLDWDVLFLIPLTWWGPVLSPVLISLLFVVGGIIAILKEEKNKKLHFTLLERSVTVISTLLILYVYMNDAIHALPLGLEAVRIARPTSFNWPLYLVAVCGLVFSLLTAIWKSSKEG
jgi:hypothetical protein